MGMTSGGGPTKSVTSAINVTPLIDVLLVLLIIFLVVMPVMLKVETLHVPRKLDEPIETTDATPLVIKVKNDLSMSLFDSSSDREVPLVAVEIARTLRPKLAAMTAASDPVVFVEFEDAVPWAEVVSTIDTVRSLSADANHDDVKVALKVATERE